MSDDSFSPTKVSDGHMEDKDDDDNEEEEEDDDDDDGDEEASCLQAL